ncbi:hypothetical protein SAMN04515678_12055 [Roseivivax sediminis]|uniref:Uncharacterized protein n=1 Tax=Roseivivax sediminis TaxID=936889 RepID=A0A1I2E5H9_9RHOB|nr:hypothetical protein SAMN04515678_12055 [Roseivivax sediminis]
MMLPPKMYAFPVSKVFELHRTGERTFLGTRFQWNTGQSEVAWERPDSFKAGTIAEEPIPAAPAGHEPGPRGLGSAA